MMATCGSCGHDVPDAARFCPDCGAPAAVTSCAECGEQLLSRARYCMSCGAAVAVAGVGPQAPVSARRVTSVLFGDLVGFTSLSESRDQEDVRELLSRYFEECRQIIARYGGTVEKFIGDAVMAVWGVPVAHEDDAERAVRAGLELVAAVAAFGGELGAPGLAMRVGIVTGEVAVTLGAEHQGMVAGDAVNTAARVQTAAAPGQVWVDESTRLLTAAAITYADAGSHQLKGKAEPMPLWTVRAVVAAVGGAQRADGLEAPLVGRDRELRLVKELFHRTEESNRPALLVVDGDAGVGKSRLAWEFEKYIDGLSSAVRWHSGRCVAYGEGVAFYALAEAIRGRLRALDDGRSEIGRDDDEDLSALLERGLEQHCADRQERSWLRPRLGTLLGIGSVGTFPREDLFSAWVTFLDRVGDGDPVTLVIDDAQHADDGFLLFVEHLLRVARFGCFVVLLTRPGLVEANPTLATNRLATLVHLASLSERDVAVLVDGLVAGLPEGVRDQLVRRSEGIPLFAVETVRSLIDRDLVVPRGGQYVLADPEALDLDAVDAPASLQALISARLDTLTAEQRHLVDRASVLGGSFTSAAVEALCRDLPDPVLTLGELVRLQILSQESSRISGDFGQFRFVQSAVRQVAYGTLSRHDRKALHLAVVTRFEADGDDADDTAAIRAQHYLDAVEAVPSAADVPELRAAALGNLRRAAARAKSLGSPGEAARHLLTAIALTEEPGLSGTVGRELAQAECDAGLYEDAIRHAEIAEAASVAAGCRVEAGRAAAVRALALANGRGDNQLAMTVAEPWWLELRGDESASDALLALTGVLVNSRARLGVDPREMLESRMKLADRAGDMGELADAYTSLATYYADLGVPGLAGVLLEASASLARAQHQPAALARTLINLTAMAMPEDVARAAEYGVEGLRVSQSMGMAYWTTFARANLSGCLWVSGQWGDLGELLEGDELAHDRQALRATTTFVALLAQARQLAWTEPYDPSRGGAVDDVMGRSFDAFAAALRALEDGDLAAAVRLGMESTELCLQLSGLWDDLIYMWPSVARTCIAAGDAQALGRLLRMVDDESEARVPLGLQAHRQHVAGLLAIRDGADPAAAESSLRSAVAGFEQWGARPARARAQADLGRLLRDQGRPEEAVLILDEARAVLVELGAQAWLADLEAPVLRATAP